MIHELTWDTAFFGRKMGRIDSFDSSTDLQMLINEASRREFKYITSRALAHEIAKIQILESHGFYLTDIGITLERTISSLIDSSLSAREGTIADSEAIKSIASGLFSNGRFYHDRFFSREEADRFYQMWAVNSLKGFADKVFLIDEKGFIACKIAEMRGHIPLIGVAGPFQHQGIGTALIQNALVWFKSKGISNVTIRTQAGNTVAIKFYEFLDFEVKTIDVTFGNILKTFEGEYFNNK